MSSEWAYLNSVFGTRNETFGFFLWRGHVVQKKLTFWVFCILHCFPSSPPLLLPTPYTPHSLAYRTAMDAVGRVPARSGRSRRTRAARYLIYFNIATAGGLFSFFDAVVVVGHRSARRRLSLFFCDRVGSLIFGMAEDVYPHFLQ